MRKKLKKIKHSKLSDLVYCSLFVLGTSLAITHYFSDNESILQSFEDMSDLGRKKESPEEPSLARERIFNDLLKNNPTIESAWENMSEIALGAQMRIEYVKLLRERGVLEDAQVFLKHTIHFKASSERLYKLQKIEKVIIKELKIQNNYLSMRR